MLRRIAVTLIALPVVVIAAGAIVFAALRLTAGESFIWQRAGERDFGGFSAIEVTGDGIGLTVISDRGRWLQGTIRRSEGRIVAIDSGSVQPLLFRKGGDLPQAFADSEGLGIASDGTAFISFELFSRVEKYPDLTGTSHRLPIHPDFPTFGLNGSLEALAIDADDVLYTIPEESTDGAFRVYRFDGAWSQTFTLPRRGAFLVSGADIFEGRLYVLERAFYGIGFASRVRRFEMDGSGERVLMQSRLGEFDNLEGIAVWRDGTDTVLTMISDDNFIPLQRTQIVEHRIPD